MAKNSKGQTVNNKKHYKQAAKKTTAKKKSTTKKTNTKKTTVKKTAPKKNTVKKTNVKKTTPKKSTVKKTTPKKKTVKKQVKPVVEKKVLDNNVSILIDEKEEKLNYNILEEVDGKEKKKTSSKIKTKFNDDLLDELESETIVNEAFQEEETTANEDKNYIEEIPVEEVQAVVPIVEETPVVEEKVEEISKIEEDKSPEEDHLEEEIAYNGFVIRLIVLVLILILSIFFVIKFCVKYINTSPMKDVSYFESSDISYSLCVNNDCNTDTIITTNVNKANIKFDYEVSFDDSVTYNVKYRIVEKFNIITSNGNVKTTTNDVLKKEISKKKVNELELSKDTVVDLGKYRKDLDDYNKENEGEHTANVVVSLYVDGISNEKEVASMTIPLSEDKIQTSIISSNMSDSLFRDENMNNYSNLYVILFGLSLLVVIFACIGVVVLINSSDNRVED